MIEHFAQFKVQITNDPFTTTYGLTFESTAHITFLDGKNRELITYHRGNISITSLYDTLDHKKPLILDECYIENFSLTDYRISRKLAEKCPIELIDFSARNAIFYANIRTDFAFGHFKGSNLSFDGSQFINGGVSFSECHFDNGDKNFTNMLFKNGNVDFSNSNLNGGRIEFKNTVFHGGIKNFQYTNFGDGPISFINTDFGHGEINFINTNFGNGDVSFKVARIDAGKIDFEFSRFGTGDISFERTGFGDGIVDFRKVEFGTGKVNFNRATFGNGDITFDASELVQGKMTFKKTEFGNGNLFFEEVEFNSSELLFEGTLFDKGSAYFGNSNFRKLSLVSCHLNQYCDFRVSHCEHLDLTDTIVRDIIDFSSFTHTVSIECLNISGMRLIGQMYIDWNENQVPQIINAQKTTSYTEKAEQFRVLKENYGRIGNYNFEDNAYIQFKRNEQKGQFYLAHSKSKWNAIWNYPLDGFKTIVFDRMGLYATSPKRVFISLLGVYFIFSLLHLICPIFLDTNINCIPDSASFIYKTLNTFYYSMITFTTVGYGDCSPVGFLRGVAAVEAFIGPFMMSYFTVAFARKILR